MSDYAASVLAAALLQGWAMSAAECKKPDCPGCPIMVSRDGKESFCARCDGGAKVGLPRPGLVDPLATANHTRASSPTSSQGEDSEYLALQNEEAEVSVPNTPPTPQSHLHSPVLPGGPEPDLPPTAVQVDPAVLAARRQQSDRASAEIGRKLLSGWTLLEETCDNESCLGVPLMRRPSPNRSRAQKDGESSKSGDMAALPKGLVDPRRHCVSCGQEYLREGDVKLFEDFMAATQSSTAQPVASTSALPTVTRTAGSLMGGQQEEEPIHHSSAAKKRRFSTQPGTSTLGGSKARAAGPPVATKAAFPHKPTQAVQSQRDLVPAVSASASSNATAPLMATPTAVGAPPMAAAASALKKAVLSLSSHLDSLCEAGVDVDGTGRNGNAIAEAAESLARTCKSLDEVKRLRGQA